MIVLALLISSCLTWAKLLNFPNLCCFYFIFFVRNNDVRHSEVGCLISGI